MNVDSIGIKIRFQDTETVRQLLLSQNLIDTSLEFHREKNHIIIPVSLTEEHANKILSNLIKNIVFEICSYNFISKDVRPKNLFEAAIEYIPDDLHDFIPKAYDVIGEIAIVDIAEEIMKYKKEIGQSLHSLFPSIQTVYRKASAVSGQLRTKNLELLAGNKKCITTHHEHGIAIYVDVCKAYFSPRLSFEHKRITDLVQNNEVIVDLFTGVGPFPLHFAYKSDVTVFAIDINEYAINCLKKSIQLNKLKGTINPLHGDCRDFINDLPKADRVLMNLPSDSHKYIDVVCKILKPGGIIHFYQFVPAENGHNQIKEILDKELAKFNWKIDEIINFQKVRESAPREIHACLEVTIKPQST